MRKILFSITVLFFIVVLQGNTTATKESYQNSDTLKLSYTNDIAPILKSSCTPCHFPPDGRKEALDNYAGVKKNIAEVLERIKLPQDHRKFMPKGKNPVIVNDSLITVLERWQKQNMPE